MLQGSRPLGVVRGGREALLTVRDVAARLGVCGATVYRLVAEGHLAHVRVLNAIRAAPRDLEAFVEGRRRGLAARTAADSSPGPLRLIALIKTEATIKKILTAMGLPAEPPPVRPARAPPSPA